LIGGRKNLKEARDQVEAVATARAKTEGKPWVAAILSVVLPGLGHFYLGRAKLGFCWFAAIQLLVVAAALIARSPILPPAVNIAGILIPLTGYLFVILSALRLTRSVRPPSKLEAWNRWYVYLGIFLVAATISSLLSDAIRGFIVKAYKIPAGAMIPTLLVGDHVYVDNLIYRVGHNPERGDVIVFRFPEDETKDFIKRVIGLPGDTIQIRNKTVYVNETPLDDSVFAQHTDPPVHDGHTSPRDNFGPVTVPDNAYFVLGDNRDHSLDSRFWGYVSASKIRGKATVIYWSWSGQGKWNKAVRWERIGQRIR
jgi:signal peptidase I